MADLAVTLLISPFIERAMSKIISLLKNRIGIALGLEKELKRLQRFLQLIQSVVQQAEERQESDPAIKCWLQDLKGVACEVVNALDECEKVLKHKVKSCGRQWIPECISFSPMFLNRMTGKIEHINKQLSKLTEYVGLINLVVSLRGQTRRIQYPKTDSFPDNSRVFGREDDVSKILTLLLHIRHQHGQHPISGISIVGMTGVGKTTLANSIYMKAKEEKLYDRVAWVRIYGDFNEQIIFGEILRHFDGTAAPTNNINALLEDLAKEFEKKASLLILDDAWNEDPKKWESFSFRLLKILITNGNSFLASTCSEEIAFVMELTPMQSYKMSGLSIDGLQNRALSSSNRLEREAPPRERKYTPYPISSLVFHPMAEIKNRSTHHSQNSSSVVSNLPGNGTEHVLRDQLQAEIITVTSESSLVALNQKVAAEVSPLLVVADSPAKATKHPSSPASGRWEEIVQHNPKTPLSYHAPLCIDGKAIVKIPRAVRDEGLKVWEDCLVGTFVDDPPYFGKIVSMVNHIWCRKGKISVTWLRDKSFLFKIPNPDTRSWVLNSGPWHVAHNTLVMRRWQPGFKEQKQERTKVPIWVKIWGIPMDVLTADGISYIASAIGVPLSLDKATEYRTRVNYAKVCIEIDINSFPTLPTTILVNIEGLDPLEVVFEYPWLPTKCATCKMKGHNSSMCKRKKPNMPKQEWIQVGKKPVDKNPTVNAKQVKQAKQIE